MVSSGKRLALLGLGLVLWAPSVRAESDDLLAPLAPATKGKKKSKPRPAPKKADKPAPSLPPEDELVSPLVPSKFELVVKLASPVPGARLFIDDKEEPAGFGQPIETTPGVHQIVVRRAGYSDAVKKVTASPGRTEVALALEPTAGFVNVVSEVEGARVFLDGREVGKVPLAEPLVVSPGSHRLGVRREGYADFTHDLQAKLGKEQTVSARLRRLPEVLHTRVINATGDVPLASELAPTDVSPARNIEIVREEPAWYQRWYVWAGAGAAAAVVATTVVLIATRPRTISPDQLCEGDPSCVVMNAPPGY